MNETAEIAKKVKKELTDLLGKDRVISCTSQIFAYGNAVRAFVLDLSESELEEVNAVRAKYLSESAKYITIYNRKSTKN